MDVRDISLHQIRGGESPRTINDAVVESLSASMSQFGILQPIRVRHHTEYRGMIAHEVFQIVAGHHRFSAAQRLGWETIPAIVADMHTIESEIASIDENLCRAELSKADRAKQTKRRKQLYEALYPETRNGAVGNGREKLRQVGEASLGQENKRFTEDTASKTGKPERTVQRDAERGTKITDEALDAIAGTPVDKGVFLDKVKKVPADKQVKYVESAIADVELAVPSTPDEVVGTVTERAAEGEVFTAADIKRLKKEFAAEVKKMKKEWREEKERLQFIAKEHSRIAMEQGVELSNAQRERLNLQEERDRLLAEAAAGTTEITATVVSEGAAPEAVARDIIAAYDAADADAQGIVRARICKCGGAA